jgi:hypothetical protein
MAEDSLSPDLLSKVSSSFEDLKVAARHVNHISDQLGKWVCRLDASVKELNLGIVAWVTIAGGDEPDDNGDWWIRELGYAKVNSKWGIALQERSGNAYTSQGYFDAWLFNDAPRDLRVQAIEHIPALLNELTRVANETAKKLQGKIEYAQKLAEAIQPPAQKRQ